jgi:hypothetical protein
MAQRVWRSDDTSRWIDGFGDGSSDVTISASATASAANATCTGNAASKTLTLGDASTFADNDFVIIHQTQKATGAGVYELNKIVSGATTTTLTMKYDLMNTYAANAQVLTLVKAKNFTINTGQTVTLPAWDGSKGGIYGVIANGDITIVGNILATGKGFRGGALSNGDPGTSNQGEGSVGTGAASVAANGNGGGGVTKALGSQCAGSGGGGNGTAGGTGDSKTSSIGGTGGLQVGTAGLTTMFFGGGSGGGDVGPNGEIGGGIIILIGKTITITGTIYSNGVNGIGSSDGGTSVTGGSAGGSVLLKGKSIVLGSGLLTATGGAKGVNSASGVQAGDGSVGRIHADYSVSLTGTTTPTIDSTKDTTITDNSGASFLFNFV